MTVNKQYFTMIQVRNALEKIADRMAEDNWEPDVIMGINRGGCIPGIYLSHRLNKPHEALDVRLRDHKAKPDLRNLEKAYAFQKKILIIDDINDTGEISVFGDNQAKMQAALDIIDKIIEEPEVDKVYEGTVVKIVDFGAFVNILPGKDGLLHISEISEERTEDVSAVLQEGQKVTVKLIGFDRGKMKLSIKALSK